MRVIPALLVLFALAVTACVARDANGNQASDSVPVLTSDDAINQMRDEYIATTLESMLNNRPNHDRFQSSEDVERYKAEVRKANESYFDAWRDTVEAIRPQLRSLDAANRALPVKERKKRLLSFAREEFSKRR